MLLILDMQEVLGLYGLARDFDATLYKNSMIAHAAIGKVFSLSVAMTTSAQQGLYPLPLSFSSSSSSSAFLCVVDSLLG